MQQYDTDQFVFSTCLILADSQCTTASSPWTNCGCGQIDFPQGVFQIITGFVSTSIIKSIGDVAMADVCNQKNISTITNDVMNSLSTKLSLSKWNALLTIKSNVDKCTKPYNSSTNTVLSKMGSVFQSKLSSNVTSLASKAASLKSSSGKTCSNLLPNMYQMSCPLLKQSVVAYIMKAVQAKLTSNEWK
uniref:Secreted protein n=1 Tax=Heterorhabditis bacteriophora TaxID=37862 RepID=A0A1I7XII1_HETBA